MTQQSITVTNDTGLHSRPADLFVRTAKLYESKITVEKDGKTADAKNIVKIILLNAAAGSHIIITADGKDEQEAVQALVDLVNSNFEKVDSRVTI